MYRAQQRVSDYRHRARHYATSIAFRTAVKSFSLKHLLHQQKIIFYAFGMRVQTLGNYLAKRFYYLYQRDSRANYAKSVPQVSSQLASF